MMEKIRQFENNKHSQADIDTVRDYFVDPMNPDSVNELAELGTHALQTMARIYASGGDIYNVKDESTSWLLSQNNNNRLEEILKKVLLSESSTRIFDSKFMGQIHPQGSKPGILGNLVAAYMNTNTVVHEVSQAENLMESAVLDWFASKFGYDKESYSGNVVTGGTSANITALWAARERTIEKMKIKGTWKRDSILYVIGTEMAHYSVEKAVDLMGPNVVFVKSPTKGYKTDTESLRNNVEAIRSHEREIMAIIGLAGETETGMVDDLDIIADIADDYGIFYHVDAAYGGPFVLSERSHLFKGISRADSITVDPHKMLYTPYSSGVILFKDKRNHMLIEKGMRKHARYLLSQDIMDGDHETDSIRNFGMSRIEGSMGSGGVLATYATIELLGDSGIKTLLNHTIELTDYAYMQVSESKVLKPLHEPETNTLLIGLRNSGMARGVHNNIVKVARDKADSRGFYISHNGKVDRTCGDFKGRSAFRMVVMHPYTNKDDVSGLINTLELEVKNQLST